MTRLIMMNSAMMPHEGAYQCRKSTPEEARDIYREHMLCGSRIESYIGYPATARILSELFGSDVQISRDSCHFDDGDIALCARLKYRVLTPAEKASGTLGGALEDYDFYMVSYRGRKPRT